MYHSQIGQDRYYIEQIAKHRRGGRFLDIGCHDGVTLSNTLALERDYGWSGVLIEADPGLARQAAANRSATVIEATVWSHPTILTIETPASGDAMLSRVAGQPHNGEYFAGEFREPVTRQVHAQTLAELLADERWVDYVSIDIEGAELEALIGVDHERLRFGFLCVEHGERYGYLAALVEFLRGVGYMLHRINLHDAEFEPFRR